MQTDPNWANFFYDPDTGKVQLKLLLDYAIKIQTLSSASSTLAPLAPSTPASSTPTSRSLTAPPTGTGRQCLNIPGKTKNK